MSLGNKPKRIFYEGQLWEFQYKTVNKTAYKSECGKVRLFSSWQIKEGNKDADTKNKRTA